VNSPVNNVIAVNAPITVEQLTFQSGRVGGTDVLTLNGLLTWSGGTFGGSFAAVNANGGAAISGSHSLDGRSLNLRGSSALSGSVGTVNGGQLINDTGATLSMSAGSATDVGTGGSQFLNRGTLRVTGNAVIASMTSTGPISVESGTLSLRQPFSGGLGAVTATGPTTVAAGAQISVGQMTSLSVGESGTLRGAGTVGGVGPVTVGSGGTLAPGTGPGVLHMSAPLTMGSGSIFQAELNGPIPGSQYDQLDLTGGSAALNGSSLQTLLAYAPAPTDALSILLGGPVSGTFAGLPNGSQFAVSFGGVNYLGSINYTPTSVVLSNFQPAPVPEPATWLLAGVAAGVWAWRRRRPQRSRERRGSPPPG